MDSPLITCIMPTANRRQFVPHAIRYFQRQTYPNRELLVLDDGNDPVEDIIPADPKIRYINSRILGPKRLGAKRNLACQLARGAYIAAWDDDDWHAPWRLAALLETLYDETDESGDPVCDLAYSWAYQHEMGTTWNTQRMEEDGTAHHVIFGTCLWKRSLWEKNPFPEHLQVAEDLVWIEDVANTGARFAAVRDPSLYVVINHPRGGGNTSSRTGQVRVSAWKRWRNRGIEKVFGNDAPLYMTP